MSGARANAALERALQISREIMQVAAGGDAVRVAGLDAERRRLLESVRIGLNSIDDEGRRLLGEIANLNDRSIGTMEHRLRATARDLDMAAVGQRAMRAYSATRAPENMGR